jgi:hypothetical protein
MVAEYMKPTIDIYHGGLSNIASEQTFLARLSSDLEARGESALIFANFFAGGDSRQIDFFVVSERCVCHVELKNYTLAVIGHKNGLWKLKQPDGTLLVLHDRQNPYTQSRDGKYALSDEMRRLASKDSNLPRPPQGQKYYQSFESVICIYPELLPGSHVPSDHIVSTKGYTELLEFLSTNERNPGWTSDNWRSFAMHLSLTRTSGSDDLRPALSTAQKSVRGYYQRLKDFYGKDLPSLVPTKIELGGREVGTGNILSFLSSGRHGLLVGPSGAGKSHHVRHMMLDAIEHGWLPILLRAQNFDGKLATLLDRSVAHLHPSTSRSLLAAATKSGHPVVLVVDGFNECPQDLKGELLETLQAFFLRRGVPILITSQQWPSLPEKLKGEEFELTELTAEEKEAVFRAYCKQQISAERVKVLTEAFRTPYEISLAAECISQFAGAINRFELFDAYVARRCLGLTSSATARCLFSELALAMSQQFVSSLPAWEAVSICDKILLEQNAPASLIDEISRTGLLDISQGFWTFRHELIGQFFAAIALERTAHAGLAQELARPRNRNLAEFTISLVRDAELVLECFTGLVDPRLMSAALDGSVGQTAKRVAEAEILHMFQRITDDLKVLRLELKFPEKDFPDAYPLLRITNGCQWSEYEISILKVIGIVLTKGRFIDEFVALVERLESLEHRVFTDPDNEEAAAKVSVQALMFQAFYHDQFIQPQPQFATATIINAARDGVWRHEHLRAPQNVVDLLQSLKQQRPGTLYFLTVLLGQYREDERIHAVLPLLLRTCWDWGFYHLRLDVIHLVEGFGYSLRDKPREAIKEILPSLLSNNPFLNTVVAEAMAKYGVLEPITDLESVNRELAQILSSPSDPTAQQSAHGAISKMFEDIYDGIYWDAIDSMSKEDQKLLYTMAAYGVPNYSFYGDSILAHLLEFNDPNTLPVFQLWASQIDVDSMSTQNAVRCYEIALRGCARFSNAPPRLKITESNSWLAWQFYGEIIFWMSKPELVELEVNDKCRKLWEALTTELIYEAVDPLMRFQNSDRSVSLKGGLASRMFRQFREPIRKILEFGLVHLDELTTVFSKGEIFNKKYREEFVVNALGMVGNHQTVELLQPLVESAALGTLAVESIRKLKSQRAEEIVSLDHY